MSGQAKCKLCGGTGWIVTDLNVENPTEPRTWMPCKCQSRRVSR